MADLLLRTSAVFIDLVQHAKAAVRKHGQEFREDPCRTLRVVHSPVMMPERDVQRFGHLVQLEAGQIRQKRPRQRHGIDRREIMGNAQTVAVFLDETDVK